jgi:MSHA type pilus biogenesis protein MshL
MVSAFVLLLLFSGCARLEDKRVEGKVRPSTSWLRKAARKEAMKRAEAKTETREKLRAKVREEVAAREAPLKGAAPQEMRAPVAEAEAKAERQKARPQLVELNLAEFAGGVRLSLSSTSLMQYTSFLQDDPPRLIINIFGTGVGSISRVMQVNKGPIKTVNATFLEKKNISRLEIELTGMVPYTISREESRIVVTLFSRPEAEEEAVERPPAVNITRFRYRKFEDQVRLEAEFEGKNPQFKVVRLKEPLRLVLTIRDALVAEAREFKPEKPLGALKEVSLSQSDEAGRPAARIEAMLTQATPYIVYQEGNVIKLDIDNPPPQQPSVAEVKPEEPPAEMIPEAPTVSKAKEAPGGEKAAKEAAPEAPSKTPSPQEKEVSAPPPPPEEGKITDTRVSLDFQDAELSDILRLLAEVSGLNIITGPKVTGKVNIKMENVPWVQALDLILRTRQYDYLKQGNVLWVDQKDVIEREKLARKIEEEAKAEEEARKAAEARTAEARAAGAPVVSRVAEEEQYVTRIFAVNYVATERSGSGGLTTSAGGGEGGSTGVSTIATEDAPDVWGTITEGLNLLLFGTPSTETTRADGQKMLIVNKFAGIIQITTTPDDMARVAEFLDTVEKSFLRQVMIQASIIEVVLSDDFQMGIDWTLVADIAHDIAGSLTDPRGRLTGNVLAFQNLRGQGVPGTIPKGLFQFGITDNDNIDILLDAMSVQGEIHTLSNPKISTLNNQKAVIKVGREEVFFNVETTISQGVSTTSATAQNITVGLVLDTTPQVNPDGKITMWVHPSITELLEIVQGPGGATAPRLTTRETDTVVTMENGQTLVLAGLIQDKVELRHSGVPFLSKIPVLGAFFRQSFEQKSKSELVIFITPTVLEGKGIREISAEEMKHFKESSGKFFKN